MREKNFLVLLILISLAIKVPIALMTANGFGVDEALYQSLAKSFLKNGFYGIKTEYYDERFVSPVFPIIQLIFLKLFGDVGMLFVSPIFSSLTVIPIYYLAREIKKVYAAKLASIFVVFNPALIVLGARPLTESLALFLFSFSLLFFYKSFTKNLYFAFSMIFFVLTFLTRYQFGAHLIFLFSSFIILALFHQKTYIIRKLFEIYNLNKEIKIRYILLGGLIGLLLQAPWFYYNYINFRNIYGSAYSQASTDVGFSSSFYLYFFYIFEILGFLFLFVFHSIYVNIKRKKIDLITFGFLVIFLSQVIFLSKVAKDRYLLPVIPFAALLFAFSFEYFEKKRKEIRKIFYILLILSVLGGLYGSYIYLNNPRYIETKKALDYANTVCRNPIMSNVFTSVWRYTDFENIPYTSDSSIQRTSIEKHNVSCIVVSLYEAPFADILRDSKDFTLINQYGKLFIYKSVVQ